MARVSSPVGLWIASEHHNQEICRSSQFRNVSIKPLDLRPQRHGNLDQSRGWSQITIDSTRTPRLSNASLLIGLARLADWLDLAKFRFSLGRDKFNLPCNICLADPRFHISSDIDLLIGADFFWNLICVGQIKFSNKYPTLQKTRLGWILAGRLNNTISTAAKFHSFHASVTNAKLHEHVSYAWQMEDATTQLHNGGKHL